MSEDCLKIIDGITYTADMRILLQCDQDRKGEEDGVTAEAGMGTAKREVVVEPDMKASYVLIDSNGCLLDNAVDEMTPVVICDCLMEDFAEGLRRLTLDREKYEARYN